MLSSERWTPVCAETKSMLLPTAAYRPWAQTLVADRRCRFSPTYREPFDFDQSILEDASFYNLSDADTHRAIPSNREV